MAIFGSNKTEHERMVYELCKKPQILATALKEDNIYIRCTEYVINQDTQEKADLVFQNKLIHKLFPNTICYIAEIKSNQGDHELLGQIEKSVDVFRKINSVSNLYVDVRGVAIAKDFTQSGLSLLNKHGYMAFKWIETECITLKCVGITSFIKPALVRVPVVGIPHYVDVDMKIIFETKFMSDFVGVVKRKEEM